MLVLERGINDISMQTSSKNMRLILLKVRLKIEKGKVQHE